MTPHQDFKKAGLSDQRNRPTGYTRPCLHNAVLRTLQVAEIAGVRALVAHAKNEAACSCCERFDFQPSPTDPLHLFALIKDLVLSEALDRISREQEW